MDRIKKKKKSSVEPKTPANAGVFVRAGPQRVAEGWVAREPDLDLQPPQYNLQKNKKNKEKRRGQRKSDETPARPNPTKSTSKPPFYATKVIPKPFTHIRGRFRRILDVEHHRQGRRNVEFLNFSRSGNVRHLQTKSIPKMELGGGRDSRMEEKGGKKDVETTLTRREKSHKKNAQATRKEDEVRSEGRIPQLEPNPITLGQPSTQQFPRPSRFSLKRVSPVTAQPDSLDPRPASLVQRRHTQPSPPTLFLQPRPTCHPRTTRNPRAIR